MMKPTLDRRQFLKLASLASLSALSPRRVSKDAGAANVIVVVFDAWSAENMSLYGYQRKTTPLIEQLAKRAVVYHQHYAAGTWTIPGAASLMTGRYPWTHRATSAAQLKIANPTQNIFQEFSKAGYSTIGATHNVFVEHYLYQFGKAISDHIPYTDLLFNISLPFTKLFGKDPEAAAVAQIRAFANETNVQSTLFLGKLFEKLTSQERKEIESFYGDDFPLGLPGIPVPDIPFLLEYGVDHLIETLRSAIQPHFSYYHFYPPHQPYRTREEFHNLFKKDGAAFPAKPDAVINENDDLNDIGKSRQRYDEFMRYVDAEFYRLYTTLQDSGALENSWLVLTSDHGEMFERGCIGHEVPTGVQPIVHIPLLIFPPGQQQRIDITTNTSAVDVLPTLLDIAGLPTPDWAEGLILPPYNSGALPDNRNIFTFRPDNLNARQPTRRGTATLVKGQMKLIYYFGLPELGEHDPWVELYDLAADPDELVNLADSQPDTVNTLLKEITAAIEQADQPYTS